MRLPIVFLLLAISIAWAANDTPIKRYMDLQTSTSCPGDMLHINATSSDGAHPAGIELRIVLYEPFYGLRGLTHTDSNGSASIQLSKTGNYRIYFVTPAYNHPDYVEFDYASMCPPPPPKPMNLSIAVDCERHLIYSNATSKGEPLDGVLMRTDSWSTMTGSGGIAFLPLLESESDYVFLSAEKSGFITQSGWFETCGGFRP
jgi:hypothetical protein